LKGLFQYLVDNDKLAEIKNYDENSWIFERIRYST
jgi:hypothetical protein